MGVYPIGSRAWIHPNICDDPGHSFPLMKLILGGRYGLPVYSILTVGLCGLGFTFAGGAAAFP